MVTDDKKRLSEGDDGHHAYYVVEGKKGVAGELLSEWGHYVGR